MHKRPDKSREDELWERVQHWRKRLAKGERSELEGAWKELDRLYGAVIWRSGDQKTPSTLLDAYCDYIEADCYPPPELMLAIFECFTEYMTAAGGVSLEEVFFGRPKRKGGMYAKRRHTRDRYSIWAEQLRILIGQGHRQIRAAELLSEKLGGKPEPESILRLVSKHDLTGLPPTKKPK